MADPLSLIQQRIGDDWLLGHDAHTFWAIVQKHQTHFTQIPPPVRLFLADPDPVLSLIHI